MVRAVIWSWFACACCGCAGDGAAGAFFGLKSPRHDFAATAGLGGGGGSSALYRPTSTTSAWATVVFAASASSDMSSTIRLPPAGPALFWFTSWLNRAPPVGGACAKRSVCRRVSRSTSRTERRSKRNESAELDPTPSCTFCQSSPEVLSTMAHACTLTLPSLPSTRR